MRKATMIAAALVAVLALSVGAVAYPVVVGSHPLSFFHTGTPTATTHPKSGDDNSTGNQTNDNETGDQQGNETGDNQGNQTGDQGNETSDNDANETSDNETAPSAPPSNETENETDLSNVTVDHNVTVTTVGTTTFVNGTIMVVENGTTVANIAFQIVSGSGNETATVTINGTVVTTMETIAVHGFATFAPADHTVDVVGVASATANGTLLWERAFAFDTSAGTSWY